MATLPEWMTANRFEKYVEDFEKKLGVGTVSDLAYVTAGDLELIKVMPVQRRRFLELMKPGRAAPSQPSRERSPSRMPLVTAIATVAGSSGVRVARRSTGRDADVDYTIESFSGDDTDEDTATATSTVPVTKRRKTVQSLLRRQKDKDVLADGSGRARLPPSYANRHVRDLSAAGTSRHTMDADRSCTCKTVLLSYAGRLAPARRSAKERRQAEEVGDRKGGQTTYKYSRLGRIATELLFDWRGNWLVHASCAGEFLGVSNAWLASRHKNAVRQAREATRYMTKSEIVSSPNVNRLIPQILRPDSCLLSIGQFFSSSAADARFELISYHTAHGLSGKSSNRTKIVERKLFSEFFAAHRTPTGRTTDSNGHFHGAAYYLDGKWTVMRTYKEDDTRLSFYAAFNKALLASGMPVVHPDVPLRWMQERFGTTRRVDGIVGPSPEHTTL